MTNFHHHRVNKRDHVAQTGTCRARPFETRRIELHVQQKILRPEKEYDVWLEQYVADSGSKPNKNVTPGRIRRAVHLIRGGETMTTAAKRQGVNPKVLSDLLKVLPEELRP